MKLYFKKLLDTLLFLIAFVALACLLCALLIHFAFWFKLRAMTLVYIGVFMSAAISSYAVFLKRWENKPRKAAYLESKTEKDYSFNKDFLATLKSKENTVHALAFLSIAFINGIRIIITDKAINGLLLQILMLSLLFVVLNTLIWCFVHRKWHKSRYDTKTTA